MGCGQSSEPQAKAPAYVPPADSRGPAGVKLNKQVTMSDYEATVHQPTKRQVTIKNFKPLTPAESGTPGVTPAASGSDHQPSPAAAATTTDAPATASEQPKESETVPPIPAATETSVPAAQSPEPVVSTNPADVPPVPPQESSQ